MSSLRVLASFLKTIRADRRLGASTDRNSTVFEQLYRQQEDPWGLRASPFTQYRYLALLERLAAFTPCRSLLDVGCGEGLFTRYLKPRDGGAAPAFSDSARDIFSAFGPSAADVSS